MSVCLNGSTPRVRAWFCRCSHGLNGFRTIGEWTTFLLRVPALLPGLCGVDLKLTLAEDEDRWVGVFNDPRIQLSRIHLRYQGMYDEKNINSPLFFLQGNDVSGSIGLCNAMVVVDCSCVVLTMCQLLVVLSWCPNLERMHAMDVIIKGSTPDEVKGCPPWTCSRLQKLKLGISIEGYMNEDGYKTVEAPEETRDRAWVSATRIAPAFMHQLGSLHQRCTLHLAFNCACRC